jgi:hypothetical protein
LQRHFGVTPVSVAGEKLSAGGRQKCEFRAKTKRLLTSKGVAGIEHKIS